MTHLENWKGLRVGSATEREALWTAPELECRTHFVTGVDYRVQILNGKLRIWASDMPQVLEYTIGTQQQEASADHLAKRLTGKTESLLLEQHREEKKYEAEENVITPACG